MPCRPRNRNDFARNQKTRMPRNEPDNPQLTDELLIVRHSGEIPEVALHGSLYYLTRDPEGPTLELAEAEIQALKRMVVERYREIIGRDLEPANRDLAVYRGLARAACNWRRLEKFCRREGLALEEWRRETRAALLAMVQREAADAEAKTRPPSINCPAVELRAFAEAVMLRPDDLPSGWESLCQEPPLPGKTSRRF
jgi:hypothetical protein